MGWSPSQGLGRNPVVLRALSTSSAAGAGQGRLQVFAAPDGDQELHVDGPTGAPLQITDANMTALNIPGGGGVGGAGTANRHALWTAAASLSNAVALTNGTLFIGSTGAAPVAAGLTAPAAGIGIAQGAGSITFSLLNDLAALEALATAGLAARTGADTWTTRAIVGTPNRVTVTDGDGVAGNPTLTGPQDIHAGATPTFSRLTLTQATGTSPLAVSSTTVNTDLNADLVDGFDASQTPTANTIPVAIAGGTLSSGWIAEVLTITQLSDVGAKTGTGSTAVMSGSPVLTTPFIGDFTNAGHTHANAAGGGTLSSATFGNDLGEVEALGTVGIAVRRSAINGGWGTRTIIAGAGGTISVVNGNGDSGNPELAVVQSALDHGSIGGLADDDHAQYSRADGTRAFTGTVSGVAPTQPLHLATRQFVLDNAGAGSPSVMDFRLSTTTADPVPADVVSATTLYLVQMTGAEIGLYDGAAWQIVSSAGLSISPSALVAGNIYAVYASNTAAPALVLGAAWTNDTTRSEALARQDGILVQSGTPTRRYLGDVRAVTAGAVRDTELIRGVYNYYNRVARHLRSVDTATRTTTSTTYAQVGGVQVSFLVGVQEDSVHLQGGANCANGSGFIGNVTIGTAVDSSDASATVPGHTIAAEDIYAVPTLDIRAPLGFTTRYLIFRTSVGGNTVSVTGTTGAQSPGTVLLGTVMM